MSEILPTRRLVETREVNPWITKVQVLSFGIAMAVSTASHADDVLAATTNEAEATASDPLSYEPDPGEPGYFRTSYQPQNSEGYLANYQEHISYEDLERDLTDFNEQPTILLFKPLGELEKSPSFPHVLGDLPYTYDQKPRFVFPTESARKKIRGLVEDRYGKTAGQWLIATAWGTSTANDYKVQGAVTDAERIDLFNVIDCRNYDRCDSIRDDDWGTQGLTETEAVSTDPVPTQKKAKKKITKRKKSPVFYTQDEEARRKQKVTLTSGCRPTQGDIEDVRECLKTYDYCAVPPTFCGADPGPYTRRSFPSYFIGSDIELNDLNNQKLHIPDAPNPVWVRHGGEGYGCMDTKTRAYTPKPETCGGLMLISEDQLFDPTSVSINQDPRLQELYNRRCTDPEGIKAYLSACFENNIGCGISLDPCDANKEHDTYKLRELPIHGARVPHVKDFENEHIFLPIDTGTNFWVDIGGTFACWSTKQEKPSRVCGGMAIIPSDVDIDMVSEELQEIGNQ